MWGKIILLNVTFTRVKLSRDSGTQRTSKRKRCQLGPQVALICSDLTLDVSLQVPYLSIKVLFVVQGKGKMTLLGVGADTEGRGNVLWLS